MKTEIKAILTIDRSTQYSVNRPTTITFDSANKNQNGKVEVEIDGVINAEDLDKVAQFTNSCQQLLDNQ